MTFTPTNDQSLALTQIRDFLFHHNKQAFILKGAAGVGKTTVINEITKEQFSKGRRVVVSAFSNKATNVISKKNPYADKMTLHKLLSLKAVEDSEILQFNIPFDDKKDSNINYYDLIVLDEVSQCSDELFNMLLNKVKMYGRKLICIGDQSQLPPINQATDCIAFNIEDSFELKEIVRQSNTSNIPIFAGELRNIIEEVKQGIKVPIETRIEIDPCNDIQFFDNSKSFLDLIIQDFTSEEYKNNTEYVKVIGYRNNTINKVNDLIRRAIFKDNTEPLIVGDRLVLNSPLYEEDSRMASMDTSDEFEILDIIYSDIYEQDHYGVKVMFPYVKATIQRLDDKKYMECNLIQPSLKEKFEEMMKDWAKKIKGQKKIFRDEWYPFLKRYNVPSYSYTMTSHKIQGTTLSKVYLLEDDIDQVKKSDVLTLYKSKYTSVTRPKDQLFILNRIKDRPVRKIKNT